MNKTFRLLLILFCGMAFNLPVNAQDVPLFGQTATNSFMYNPALAGYEKGVLTLSSRQTFTEDIAGLPNTNFLSFQSPLELGKLGFGGNILYEQIGVFRQIQSNISGSYHIRLKDKMTWSMGLGAEIYSASINQSKLDVLDYDDEMIQNFSKTEMDFSAGAYFSYDFIGIGMSFNRLRSWMDNKDLLGNYVNVFVKGDFQLNRTLRFQPIAIYRQTRNYKTQFDAGFLMFINEKFLTGLNYRNNGQLSGSLGANVSKKFWAAYTYEVLTEHNVSSHEITLRFEFSESRFPNTVSNYKSIKGKDKYKRMKKELRRNKMKNINSEIIKE